ncbi:hypothetical protein PQX77_017321 [Marasmius sp. AFHP31]|nr:hypothetical protein PQX77_017321 [Marasmius sp. AFHP31]
MKFPMTMLAAFGFLAGLAHAGDSEVLLYQLAEGTNIEFFQRAWVTGCTNHPDRGSKTIKTITALRGDFDGNNLETQVRVACVFEDADGNTFPVTEELAERSGATRVQ